VPALVRLGGATLDQDAGYFGSVRADRQEAVGGRYSGIVFKYSPSSFSDRRPSVLKS
jgi:hypothetical protein